nr:hypothetical protein [Tanacetum cinerariifolium]
SSANCIESLTKDLELLKKEKGGIRIQCSSSPPAQLYSPPKKDLSWTGLFEFKDDTVTDYSRPSPTIESSSDDAQNRNPSVTKTEASHSTILSKPVIKFIKGVDRAVERTKTDKGEAAKKPTVKYVKLYTRTSKSSKVRGNQRNWNNLKSHQLGEKLKDAVRTKRRRGVVDYILQVKKKDCPDCEVSRALSFCLSFTRASHP